MTLQMAPGKSIGYSRFYNRYKMVVIIEMYGRIFYFKHHKDEQFFAKNSKFWEVFWPSLLVLQLVKRRRKEEEETLGIWYLKKKKENKTQI